MVDAVSAEDTVLKIKSIQKSKAPQTNLQGFPKLLT
jgi:hypothetical protein